MEKHYLNLMQFFEGYVRNYRRMNFSHQHNLSMFTQREIDHFANLGEMLGFEAYIEDGKMDNLKGFSRPMDLSWWKWDARESQEDYHYLALHLERENVPSKDIETIEKLFSETVEGYTPHNVIGIQFVESVERILVLNELIKQKNEVQNSNVLMIYRYEDPQQKIQRVDAYYFDSTYQECRKAFCLIDEWHYWFMVFEEEHSSLEFSKRSKLL
ncbi:hypothetical protein [Planococcus donghaensis]|uniref:hypothetical protein n=1 Tax=Planococcus donghaensis TaxID=414778 RepID=UPI0037366F0E